MISDFRDLLTAFTEAGVRFLVVGAHALAAHGVPRVTGDLDIWVESAAANATRICAALPVAFIGRDAFIANKRASGRAKDLEDLRSLGA